MRRMLAELGLHRKYLMDKVFLDLEQLQMMEIDGRMIEGEGLKNREASRILSGRVTCT